MTDGEFYQWLLTAAPGEQCVYFQGHLGEAVWKEFQDGRESKGAKKRAGPLHDLQTATMKAYEDGLVCLTQKLTYRRSMDPHDARYSTWDYIAVKTAATNARRAA